MLPTEIIGIRHPYHITSWENWYLWRLTYESGDAFIQRYLDKFSKREEYDDYLKRKQITYCPAFAKAAINDIRNAIFQRLSDVTREGGSLSFNRTILGLDGGIDKRGSSINYFMGKYIIPELLTMSRVGVYVDMPVLNGPTIADKGNAHPYIYMFPTEQIRSWTYHPEDPELLTSVLLEEEKFLVDDDTGLTTGTTINYRHMWLDQYGGVRVQYYDSSGNALYESPQILTIGRIPFIILEISNSLLAEAARYQIALLNIESSDLLYILKSNFPFYTEQFDPRSVSPYTKQPGREEDLIIKSDTQYVTAIEKVEEIAIGSSSGRRYPIGAERPQFIAPPEGPIRISMEKSEQLKRDIRLIINLAAANLEPKRSSADSKIADERPMDNGLVNVGLELERAEQYIAWLWAKYQGETDIATIKYPKSYELKGVEEKKLESDNLKELIPKIPSNTFRKEATKRIIDLTIGSHIPYATLEKIESEIDRATVVYADPKDITQDLENCLVSLETASKARGYPAGEVEKAKEDRQERLEIIAMSQTKGLGMGAARGLSDTSVDPKEAKQEKQNVKENSGKLVPSYNGRGEGQ